MKISEIVSDLSTIKLLEFERTTNAFNYVFEKDLAAGEAVIIKMPAVSANKRGINDIGWLSDGDITLYGTISKNPRSDKALCQEIRDHDEVNKVTSALIVKNNGGPCRIEFRAIFN
jgi:hypothetical protein